MVFEHSPTKSHLTSEPKLKWTLAADKFTVAVSIRLHFTLTESSIRHTMMLSRITGSEYHWNVIEFQECRLQPNMYIEWELRKKSGRIQLGFFWIATIQFVIAFQFIRPASQIPSIRAIWKMKKKKQKEKTFFHIFHFNLVCIRLILYTLHH